MKSLTFYFISPYCILKEVNRKTFANYTTVYWLLGWLLLYLSEALTRPAVPASASSFLLCARGAQEQLWVLSKAFEPFTSRQLAQGWKWGSSGQPGKLGKVMGLHGFGVMCWANGRAWSWDWKPVPAVGHWEAMAASSFCGARTLCSVSWLCVWAQESLTGKAERQSFAETLIAWAAAAVCRFERNLLNRPLSLPPSQCAGLCFCFPVWFPL